VDNGFSTSKTNFKEFIPSPNNFNDPFFTEIQVEPAE